MQLKDFVEMVSKMRSAQKAWFRNKQPSMLDLSKRMEAQVDRMLADHAAGPGLFDRPGSDDDDLAASIDATHTAIKVIKEKHGKAYAKGFIDCPACGDELHYTVNGYNGHTGGECSRDGCLRWRE